MQLVPEGGEIMIIFGEKEKKIYLASGKARW
jgi:hypothetical protein